MGQLERREWTHADRIDKSDWGAGPWQTEPDEVRWRDAATSLHCLALRHPELGNWCGYVGVGPAHPLYEASYDAAQEIEYELDVHGGLTFSGGRLDNDLKLWWFGFDCAHAWDLSPGMAARLRQIMGYRYNEELHAHDVYRPLAYVEAEVTRLAAQLVRDEHEAGADAPQTEGNG